MNRQKTVLVNISISRRHSIAKLENRVSAFSTTMRIPDFSIDFHIIKLLLLDMLTDDPITLLYLSL